MTTTRILDLGLALNDVLPTATVKYYDDKIEIDGMRADGAKAWGDILFFESNRYLKESADFLGFNEDGDRYRVLDSSDYEIVNAVLAWFGQS